MEPADLDAVTALEQVTYATPWSEQVFRAELAQTDRIYLLAEDDGALAGYAGLMLVGDEAHVTTVAVDDAWRGKRVGTGLMMRLIDGAIH
ncbi:MAG: GNAT family N-acetyltransferase, partial [Acidimicrobiia bacterium]|nr:GNAT family N-acetyltransferase [Acidimicrobiia bacterium]